MPDEIKIPKGTVRLMVGDFTDLETEAIVFYARPDLVLGSGFGGAISGKGGPKIQEEFKKLIICLLDSREYGHFQKEMKELKS